MAGGVLFFSTLLDAGCYEMVHAAADDPTVRNPTSSGSKNKTCSIERNCVVNSFVWNGALGDNRFLPLDFAGISLRLSLTIPYL